VKRPWSSRTSRSRSPGPPRRRGSRPAPRRSRRRARRSSPAQTPSLFSVSRVVTPGHSRSTMNAEMPLCFAPGSVFANTSWWSATVAYEIQFFWPLRHVDVALEPRGRAHRGDVRPRLRLGQPKHASFSPRACGARYCCFCSSVP
jgi:hypothetical protein